MSTHGVRVDWREVGAWVTATTLFGWQGWMWVCFVSDRSLSFLCAYCVFICVCFSFFSFFFLRRSGVGSHGRLGHDSDANEYRPRKVNMVQEKCMTKVACGTFHTLMLTKCTGRSGGELYVCGGSYEGRLGQGKCCCCWCCWWCCCWCWWCCCCWCCCYCWCCWWCWCWSCCCWSWLFCSDSLLQSLHVASNLQVLV